jgi:hypothetical protein
MALEVYLYWERMIPPSRSKIAAYCGCTGTTHDMGYLPKPLRADRRGVLGK